MTKPQKKWWVVDRSLRDINADINGFQRHGKVHASITDITTLPLFWTLTFWNKKSKVDRVVLKTEKTTSTKNHGNSVCFAHCPKYIRGPKRNRKKCTNIQGEICQEKRGQSKYLLQLCKASNHTRGNQRFIWAQTKEQKGYIGATCRIVSSHVHLLSTATLLDKWKKTKIILR